MEEGVSVLIIEDDRILADTLSLFLREQGYIVTAVGTGKQGLDLAQNTPYGVIIIDLHLPDIPGGEILQELSSAQIPATFIVISGAAGEAEMVACYDQGADFVLHKPFDLKKLHALIKRSHQLNTQDARFSLKRNIEGWVELTADSYFGFLERIKNVIQVLRIVQLDEETQQDIAMALDEMGRNAIEWGNGSDSEKKISISYALFASEIVFKVEDEGGGFERNEDDKSDVLSRLLDRKKEGKRPGGFGITMVKKVMDKVIYNQRGNVVLISKSFK